MDHVEVYRRTDDRWAWRRKAPNGRIVATDGGQGYDHLSDALTEAEDVNAGVLVTVLRSDHVDREGASDAEG